MMAPGGNPDLKCAYTTEDMADDAVAVLDHYKIDKAHILGMSMGGLIAQIVATKHAQRCLSATFIMTSSALNKSFAQSFANNPEWIMQIVDPSRPKMAKGMTVEQLADINYSLEWHLMKTPEHQEDAPGLRASCLEVMA